MSFRLATGGQEPAMQPQQLGTSRIVVVLKEISEDKPAILRDWIGNNTLQQAVKNGHGWPRDASSTRHSATGRTGRQVPSGLFPQQPVALLESRLSPETGRRPAGTGQ